MSLEIDPELQSESMLKVELQQAASFLNSEQVAVFATPEMIRVMEYTCRVAADTCLPPEYTTVGTEVCVKHLAAAPVGATVQTRIRLEKQKDRRLHFWVETWWNTIKIGEGRHERYIIHRERFLNRLATKKNKK